jgi:hypothetical protein
MAITLAHMASHLVDAPKSGLRLRQDKWNKMLSQLGVAVPEYIKSTGDARVISSHVMDVLVLGVIPMFQNQVLQSYNENVHADTTYPIDCDIKEFYDALNKWEPEIIDCLRPKLSSLYADWFNCIGKSRKEQNRHKHEVMLSPKKRKTRSNSSRDGFKLVSADALLVFTLVSIH